MDLDAAVANDSHATARKLLKAVEEFHTYIANKKGFIPNYGERYHAGERISTGVVESTVNQVVSKRFCKRQQMQWTKRAAHLLLHVRVKVLNRELGVCSAGGTPMFLSRRTRPGRRSPQICMLSWRAYGAAARHSKTREA